MTYNGFSLAYVYSRLGYVPTSWKRIKVTVHIRCTYLYLTVNYKRENAAIKRRDRKGNHC